MAQVFDNTSGRIVPIVLLTSALILAAAAPARAQTLNVLGVLPDAASGELVIGGGPFAPGIQGNQGIQGTQGSQGVPGVPGPPGPAGGGATTINVSLVPVQSQLVVVPYGTGTATLRFLCADAPGTHWFGIGVPAGTGAVELTAIKSMDDASMTPYSGGAALPTPGYFVVIGYQSPYNNLTTGHYYRMGGTMVLHSGPAITTIVFDVVLDARGAATCQFRGTVVAGS